MSEHTMSECTAVHAAAFRLPPFSTTDTMIWFRRAEIQFPLKKITVSSTKADYVLAALPDCVPNDTRAGLCFSVCNVQHPEN